MKHTILLLAVVALTASVRAGGEHGHGHSHEHIAIPVTLPEVQAEITVQQQKLTESLAARDADAAHAATDALSALVKSIPDKAEGSDEATLQRLRGMANNAVKAWGNTAHDAEDGDYEKAGREAAKADAAYQLLLTRLSKE